MTALLLKERSSTPIATSRLAMPMSSGVSYSAASGTRNLSSSRLITAMSSADTKPRPRSTRIVASASSTRTPKRRTSRILMPSAPTVLGSASPHIIELQ